MGSLMEPGDIAAFKNSTTICTFADRIHCTGVFTGANPLDFSVPLLFLQLAMCAGTIILFSQLLKPLGQPLIVSQILGGLVLGSSGLSHLEKFREAVFPLRGFILLDVVSVLGLVFYYFLIGVQTDISILKRIDKGAFGIGFFSTLLPIILSSFVPGFFVNIVDTDIVESIFVVGRAEAFINFTMVASLLSELHLINCKLGRIALSSSMASNLTGFFLLKLKLLFAQQSEARFNAFLNLYGFIFVVVIIVFVIRPSMLWMIKKNPAGQPLKEGYVITLLLGVLVVAFCSKAFGLHIYFVPFVFGITIPPGPPIGSALVDRLDFITSWVFMPIFFVKIGLVVDIYTIKLINFLCISFTVFLSALGKFLGAFMMSIYFKMPVRDAVSLGIVLNSQGALELSMFNILRKDKLMQEEAFVVVCICLMVMVAIVTRIISYLWDPSRRYVVDKRRTVMHSRPEFDFCVLVCIHDQDNVPSAINILEALNPTRRSHLDVYMLHLVELLGRASPQLIHHKLMEVRNSSCRPSEPIVNAFKYFALSNREIVAIHPFTAISPSTSMHDDVCSLALDKRTSLILVPFHKRFHSNGMLTLSNHKTKMVNHHILDQAPCSVALVVERGFLKVSRSIATYFYSFQIAVVFIGGPDDREAMFIGARMAGHPNINLVVIRLLENENVPSDDVKERMLDNEALVEFQQIMADNYRVRYIEEVVNDGTGTVSILRSMGNTFDLVMVGRRHSPCSVLVQGLVLWNEETELGAIGEVLASSDFIGNAMILVVQQHTKVVNEDQENQQENNYSFG